MDSRNPKDNRPRPPGNTPNGSDPNFNWKGIILIAIAFMLIAGAFLIRPTSQTKEINYSTLIELLQGKQIDSNKEVVLSVEEGRNTQVLSGWFYRTKPTDENGKLVYTGTSEEFRLPVYMSYNKDLEALLKQYGIVANVKPNLNMFAGLFVSLLPVMILVLLVYFFFRQQIRMAGKGALNFGKSRARMMSRDKNKITFKDVAGVEEAKEEVQELVDFLKDPKRFQKLGGRIPKGVLMVGPPGTGKTLLARAIAGEADVPFFSISGSDFVEMFVGVGASRVRDMFEQGKKAAPCLIFIDEIDAVGRHRGHGVGGGHDEREQTLNALLVEMDGFDTQEGVIIIAATNRPDVLDPALLRPGRFDRQITVNLPDVKGREQILNVHAKKVKIAEGVDLAVLARGTPGYSGAELANVINEAALIAARKSLKGITMVELEDARDKVRWGRERRSLAMSEKEKVSTAWHEAGHALVSVLLEHTDPLHKVTIIPRGHALGVTMSLPEGDQYSFARKEALDRLALTAAGRIAEALFTNDVSTGASNDIKQMTRLARKMVCEWGMSDKMGMIEYGEHEDYVFLGRDISRNRDYSESTAQAIDLEVKTLIDSAYKRAEDLIMQNRDKIELIAKALREYESLDGDQIRDIAKTGGMSNPPTNKPDATPPPMPPQSQEGLTIAPTYPSGLTGAPAGA